MNASEITKGRRFLHASGKEYEVARDGTWEGLNGKTYFACYQIRNGKHFGPYRRLPPKSIKSWL